MAAGRVILVATAAERAYHLDMPRTPVSLSMKRSRKTWKAAPLEALFLSKYDPDDPQEEIPFTNAEAYTFARKFKDPLPGNFHNFIKDLVRTGNPHPTSPSAFDAGYLLRETPEEGVMGVWFKGDLAEIAISVSCPSDLEAEIVEVSSDPLFWDHVRDDEGGCLSVIKEVGLLARFFDLKEKDVRFIQSPVKLQPTEIDGIFVAAMPEGTVFLPCEAKSRKGRDALNLNQIIGGAASALDNFLRDGDAGVIPVGAKILKNGDVYIVAFPFVGPSERDGLEALITPSSVIKQARYRLSPRPPNW
jgi:hypothetical protein